MNNHSLVYEAINKMENHLRSTLTVTEVAEQIGFSSYYFSHLFKAVTGISPSVYLGQRKLADSVELLMTTDKKIIDIAFIFGYSSSEEFSRAFSKNFKQTPTEVRKQGLKKGELMMRRLNENHTLAKSLKPFRTPELVSMDDLYLAGISFYFDFSIGKNDLYEQWTNLTTHLEHIPYVPDSPSFYQMQMWFEEQSAETIYFYIAVGVDKEGELPIQMSYKKIPKGKYLRFYHKGLANQVGETYQYIYEEWLPRTEYKLAHHFNFEYYGDENLGPYNPESITEIYIPVEV